MANQSGKAFEVIWLIIGALIMIGLLWMALPFVSPIVFALFLYYIARPIKRRLHRYVKNESVLALLCLLAIAGPVLVVLGYALVLAIGQIGSLLSNVGMPTLPPGPVANMSAVAPSLLQGPVAGGPPAGNVTDTLQGLYDLVAGYPGQLPQIRDVLVSSGLVLVDVVFKVSLMFIIAFLLLVKDDRLARWLRRAFPRLVDARQGTFTRFARGVDADLEAVFFGNMLSVIFFGIIAIIVYSLLNHFAPDPSFLIPYPVLLGILCGLFAFLPLLGPWMIDVPILLFAAARSLMAGSFSDHWWYLVVMAVVISVFVENLPNYVLRPFVSHGKVDVGLLMLAYLVGPLVFGIPGLFIGAILLVLATNYFDVVTPAVENTG